jgi:hypothetical protein
MDLIFEIRKVLKWRGERGEWWENELLKEKDIKARGEKRHQINLELDAEAYDRIRKLLT